MGMWEEADIRDNKFPYLQRINFLLKIFATLARERVTAMGSPSGMKATIKRRGLVRVKVWGTESNRPMTETISTRRVGTSMVPGKERRSL